MQPSPTLPQPPSTAPSQGQPPQLPQPLFPLPLQLSQPAPAPSFAALNLQQPPLQIPMPTAAGLQPMPLSLSSPSPPTLLPFPLSSSQQPLPTQATLSLPPFPPQPSPLPPPSSLPSQPPTLSPHPTQPPLPSSLPSIISDPSDWQAHNEAGMVMHRNGLLEQAVEHLTLAAQFAPDTSAVRRNLAMVKVDIGTRYKLSGAVADAMRCYEEALQGLQSFAPAYFNLAVIFSERGQYEQALKYYQLATRYNPNYVEALCVQEDTRVRVKRGRGGRGGEERCEDGGGWMDVRVGDVTVDDVLMDERGQETCIQPPIVPIPDQPLYRVECFRDGELQEGGTDAVPFAQFDVSDRHLLTVLCRSPPTLHRSSHALQLLYYRLVEGRLHESRLSEAYGKGEDEQVVSFALWKRWREEELHDACVQGELYDVLTSDLHHHLQGDAAHIFRRHITGVQLSHHSSSSAALPPPPPTYLPVDLLLTPLRHLGRVIGLCVTSPTHRYLLSPSLPTRNCNIGVIYKNSAQLSMAIEYYEKALKANPNFHIAASNLAIALTDKGTSVKNEGRIEEGIAYYKRALHHNSKYPSSWYNLGVAYAEKGRPDDAKVCLTGDHRVLTRSGWRSITAMQLGDEVLSFNVDTYAQEWKPVTAVTSHAVDAGREEDSLYRMQGSGMDVIATRDHRMLTARTAKRMANGMQARTLVGYETVGQLLPPAVSYSKDQHSTRTSFAHSQSRSVVCAGVNRQAAVQLLIPGLERVCEWWWRRDEQCRFLHFLGFWLSAGWLDVTNGLVAISHKQQQKHRSWLAEELLPSVFPGWWSCCPHSSESATLVYHVRCPPLCDYLRLKAVGSVGHNPLDPAKLRSYPHLTENDGLAAKELRSAWHVACNSRSRASTWTETAMLAALTGGSPSFTTRTLPSTPTSASIASVNDEDAVKDEEDNKDEEVCEDDDAPLAVKRVDEQGDTAWIPRACAVENQLEDEAGGTASRAAGKAVQWHGEKCLGSPQQITDVYSRLSRRQAIALLDGFVRADGHCVSMSQYDDSGEPTGSWEVSHSSFPLIDQLQLIAQLAGARVHLSLADKAGQDYLWQLSLSFSQSSSATPFSTVPLAMPVDVSNNVDACGFYQHEDDGRVYCITVADNSNFITQRLATQRLSSGALSVHAHPVCVGNCYEMAVLFDGRCAEAYNNLGVIYKDRGNLDQAIHYYHEALQANPSFSQTLNNLSVIYTMLGKLDEAYEYCSRAIRTNPNYAEALNNLGVLYRDEGRIEEAIQSYGQCLRIDQLSKNAGQNRLLALNSLTRLDPALGVGWPGKEEAEVANGMNGAGSPSAPPVFAMSVVAPSILPPPSAATTPIAPNPNFSPSDPLSCLLPPTTPEQDQSLMDSVYEAHRQWGLAFSSLFERDRYTDWPESKKVKERQLRIGYLSADFFVHSVSYFIEAPLVYRDRTATHVTCYSNVARKDKKTSYFEKMCDTWRNVHDKSGKEVGELIRRDRIDILVELTGHTAGNRLDVMALKPAPVQVTWIGYPNTTGLPFIDYRITDSIVDPPDSTQKYTETLLRLPGPFLCYTPPADAPPVTSTPALKNGYLTFGSFNNLAKVNDRVLAVWCAILHSVPFSRMLMKCKPFASPTVVAKMHVKFAAFGIPASRVDLISLLPTTTEHLDAYANVDISVDTFPYAGTTTSCEALYMGVPVITYQRRRPSLHAHNVGATLLSRIGVGEEGSASGGGGGQQGVGRMLIAGSEAEYVELAVRLASDVPALQKLRQGLREQMLQSSVCRGKQFVEELEKTYRKAWEAYCDTK